MALDFPHATILFECVVSGFTAELTQYAIKRGIIPQP